MAEKMVSRNKRKYKEWQKEEKAKVEAIKRAYRANNDGGK